MSKIDGIITPSQEPQLILVPPPQPQPLLSKNEYVALELTRIRHTNGNYYMSSIYEDYQWVLDQLNKKGERN